jgi:hypothetical protein
MKVNRFNNLDDNNESYVSVETSLSVACSIAEKLLDSSIEATFVGDSKFSFKLMNDAQTITFPESGIKNLEDNYPEVGKRLRNELNKSDIKNLENKQIYR